MCSVVGCDSDPRVAQMFKLPKDPEMRLEWVQFLATVNKQRFKESSWTDIAICSRHFKSDCFNNLAHLARIRGKSRLTLKPSAVPSCFQSDEAKAMEAMEKEGISTDTSDDVISVYGQMHPKNVNFDLISEKASLLQMKRRYVVNEKRLLQLFSCVCPICGSETKVEKVTSGVLIILNQHCLHCEYRNQWKSQVNASVPAAEDQHLTVGTDITSEIQQAVATDGTHSRNPGVPETVAVIGEESDHMDETGESSEEGDIDSDEDWKPTRAPQTETEEEVNDDCPPLSSQLSQLCTDCGKFFSKQRPHTCEHKIKPYACNICGKRYVSEVTLNVHSKIHDESYEHRCKYCYIIFKTMVDRVTHEKTHMTEEKPYKCPECSETFAKNKQLRVHLVDHRGPPQLKCHICGMEFNSEPYLQRHLAVHTGEKRFKCSVCQRGFKQASHLKSHVRLHTGERPYKCQHCDKCFNHNVSLKSHVQRYHATNSGCEQKSNGNTTVSDTIENENNTGDAESTWNKTGTDSELGNVEEPETNQEVQKERLNVPKAKRRTTGRPIGRPKRNESSSVLQAVEVKSQCSSLETVKQQVQKLKRKQCSDEESQGPSDSDTSSDSAKEKKERHKEARTKRRPKNSDSDSEFDPEENKKKRYRSQNVGKNSGKCSGRPRKNVVL